MLSLTLLRWHLIFNCCLGCNKRQHDLANDNGATLHPSNIYCSRLIIHLLLSLPLMAYSMGPVGNCRVCVCRCRHYQQNQQRYHLTH